MKFYNREKEKNVIKYFMNKSKGSRILVITGRRRIGKTRLVNEIVNGKGIYLFTKRKSYKEIITEWTENLKKYEKIYGEFKSFEELLEYLFDRGRKKKIIIIFDEIQNLYYSDKSAFSTFQKVFDLNKEKSSILFIFTGSIYSLMEKIFKNAKEPLFGRASEIIKLSYLPIKAQERILKDYKLFSGENLLHLFSIFDGTPYYVEEFVDIKKKTFKSALRTMIVERNFLWEEGENILKEEFGKEYSIYFSILQSITKGKRTRNEISQEIGIKELGGFLNNLEKVYKIIERRVPIFKKNANSKLTRYYLRDNFLTFWFYFMDRYRSYKELGQNELAFNRIWKELPQYEGKKLEAMVLRKIIEENPLNIDFSEAGNFWNRKGTLEVDLILLNKNEKIAYIFEIKRNRKKITQKIINHICNLNNKIEELKYYKIVPVIAFIDKNGLNIEIMEK